MKILKDFFNGAIIGVANIIPGVSGGTMALILGFYERLIGAINNISLTTIIIFLKALNFKKENIEELKNEYKRIDANFLIIIAFGALFSIVSLAKIMPILLEDYHDPTYGFFFGLIIISAIYPYKLIKKKTIAVFLIAVISIILIIAVSNAASGEKLLKKEQTKIELKIKKHDLKKDKVRGKTDFKKIIFMFIIGAISISAMILPGISGSFLLLLLGGYIEILRAITNRDFIIILSFGFGCILGIALFSRLINYFLKKFHDLTMSFLLGLVVGSLWVIWPFKISTIIGKGTAYEKTVYLANKIPLAFKTNEIYTLIAILAGMTIVGIMMFVETKTNKI